MEKIYSKINGQLLHQIIRLEEITPGRINLSEDDKYIQCAALNLPKNQTFKPHKHNINSRNEQNYIPQESWCVIKGSVKCIFYDIDDNIIAEPILNAGDASFTYFGGHNYFILEDNTIVYEYKTGPYLGQSSDKTFI
jgi:hypothetical protein